MQAWETIVSCFPTGPGKIGSTGDGFPKQPHLYTLLSPPLGPTHLASFLSPAPLAGPAQPWSPAALHSVRSVHPLGPAPPTFFTSFNRRNNVDSHVPPPRPVESSAGPARPPSCHREWCPACHGSNRPPRSGLSHLRSTCAAAIPPPTGPR